MPRTLLLALIVTAMTACNRSGAGPGVAKAPDNARKPPGTGADGRVVSEPTEADAALAH